MCQGRKKGEGPARRLQGEGGRPDEKKKELSLQEIGRITRRKGASESRERGKGKGAKLHMRG